jgi:uncharacterized protein YdhG (YjbR/CyaY superfamily)
MTDRTGTPTGIDEYIAGFSPPIQMILKKIRATIAAAAPGAQERMSYRMPAFAQEGILLYFAAFKTHIGVYPPVSGDRRLEKALSAYSGPKGNLKFPLDHPIPYGLIGRIATLRVKQNLARVAVAERKRQAARRAPSNKAARGEKEARAPRLKPSR